MKTARGANSRCMHTIPATRCYTATMCGATTISRKRRWNCLDVRILATDIWKSAHRRNHRLRFRRSRWYGFRRCWSFTCIPAVWTNTSGRRRPSRRFWNLHWRESPAWKDFTSPATRSGFGISLNGQVVWTVAPRSLIRYTIYICTKRWARRQNWRRRMATTRLPRTMALRRRNLEPSLKKCSGTKRSSATAICCRPKTRTRRITSMSRR